MGEDGGGKCTASKGVGKHPKITSLRLLTMFRMLDSFRKYINTVSLP